MQKALELETSFNKERMDACNRRCLQINTHRFLTPTEVQCFSQCTSVISRERFNSEMSHGSSDSSPLMSRKASLNTEE